MNDAKAYKEFKTLQIHEKVEADVNKLTKNFNRWESRKNKGLYNILADCMAIALEIDGNDVKKKGLNKLLKHNDIGTNSATSTFNKVLKLVVGDGRKRTSKYAKVLEKADALGIEPTAFVEWIKVKGIENTLKKDDATEKPPPNPGTNDNAVKLGEELIKKCSIAKNVGLVPDLKFKKGLIVLVGKYDPKEGIKLLKFVPDQTVLESIFSTAGKLKSSKVSAETTTQQRQKTQFVNDLSNKNKVEQSTALALSGAS